MGLCSRGQPGPPTYTSPTHVSRKGRGDVHLCAHMCVKGLTTVLESTKGSRQPRRLDKSWEDRDRMVEKSGRERAAVCARGGHGRDWVWSKHQVIPPRTPSSASGTAGPCSLHEIAWGKRLSWPAQLPDPVLSRKVCPAGEWSPEGSTALPAQGDCAVLEQRAATGQILKEPLHIRSECYSGRCSCRMKTYSEGRVNGAGM